jgi:hypothetical protein
MKIQEEIAERMKYLDSLDDEVERCERVSRRYIDMGRQLGKTTLMMKNLKEGDTILAWKGSEMKKLVQQYRPDLDISKIYCHSVRNLEELKQYSGTHPCLVDNVLWDMILSKMVKDFHSGNLK